MLLLAALAAPTPGTRTLQPPQAAPQHYASMHVRHDLPFGEYYQSGERNFSLPEPSILGRMILTQDIARAQAFYVDHMGGVLEGPATPLVYPRSNTTIETCASVVRVRLPSFSNQLITLVHDSVKPNPAPEFPITQVLAEAERDMLNVTSRGAPLWWTTWEDNHDGYGSPLTLNPSLLYHPPQGSPKVGVQCYGNILRTSVPQSMMTIEWNSQENSTYQFIGDANGSYVMIDRADDWAQASSFNEEGHVALGRNCVPFDLGPDVGRDADVDIAYVNEELFVFKGWFKATTSTSDPASAAAAAVRYIGGRRAPSPYESLTPPPGGHYAQWVLMTTNTDDHPRTQTRPMWLHFVYTPTAGNVSAGQPNPYSLAQAVISGRHLERDIFDRYMYNTIQFSVASVAPAIRLLRQDGVPFIMRRARVDSADGSVFFAIPGSTYAFELVGAAGLENESAAKVFDFCSTS